MKHIQNITLQKNLLILSATFFVILSLSYIICIYKTVVLASDSEANNKAIALLSADINQKDFDYIGKISDIDLNHALALGYRKNVEGEIAYLNIHDTSELAIR